VSPISVLIAATAPDIKADGIAAGIAARDDMALLERRIVTLDEVVSQLARVPGRQKVALILVGAPASTEPLASELLRERSNLVILNVDIAGDELRVSLRDIGLQALLTSLRDLVERVGSAPEQRLSRIRLAVAGNGDTGSRAQPTLVEARPVMRAALEWIRAVLVQAVGRLPDDKTDFPGAALTRAAVLELMSSKSEAAPATGDERVRAEAELHEALAKADPRTEPLAALAAACQLTRLEFRLALLALAPELEPRFQRCLALLQDDASRRVGSVTLYASLLGSPPETRLRLSLSGHGARWRLWDTRGGRVPSAEEPMRLDPHLVEWLMGNRSALDHDPRIRRLLRGSAWPGATLLASQADDARALAAVSRILPTPQAREDPPWVVYSVDAPASWRALLERGAHLADVSPIRIEATHTSGLDATDLEDAGARLGRVARLMGRPLIVDIDTEASVPDDETLRMLLEGIGRTAVRCGVICSDLTRVARVLGSTPLSLADGSTDTAARATHVLNASRLAGIELSVDAATTLALKYPLQADGFELAMRIARTRRRPADEPEQQLEGFAAACQDVATEGASRFAQRIHPPFKLEDVILPPDRGKQLLEIVNNVLFTSKVLDEWNFREQLPYGRGVSCLFHGPSGTGKTMASLAVAGRIGVQVLRVDLSRVMSKFIGEIEKAIDRVFLDATQSGAAVLFDEAEALFGRRSEVRDAHDRYANIEVAYLLQRLEAFDGLAILTTNLRQNVDPAFMRRLRFVVDFPRPNAEDREKIWRRCLAAGSHELNDEAFLLLSRRLELAGGNIRQITLRAAFAAAAANSKIKLDHINEAGRAELLKLGLPAVELTVRKAA
jgi:AAA+ superfamily predicted ATPase